jgi:hypothetical protein
MAGVEASRKANSMTETSEMMIDTAIILVHCLDLDRGTILSHVQQTVNIASSILSACLNCGQLKQDEHAFWLPWGNESGKGLFWSQRSQLRLYIYSFNLSDHFICPQQELLNYSSFGVRSLMLYRGRFGKNRYTSLAWRPTNLKVTTGATGHLVGSFKFSFQPRMNTNLA